MGGCRPKEFRGNGWDVSKDLVWLIVTVRRVQKAEIIAVLQGDPEIVHIISVLYPFNSFRFFID